MQLASQRACGHLQRQNLSSQGSAPRHLPQAALPAGHASCRRCPHPAAALASDADAGDERLQDNLVDMIHVQIGQQHVKTYFEDESDRLRRTAEEAKEEVDKMAQLEMDRSTLAFGSAMADINQSADEFEAQLLAQRRENEADAAAFQHWQRQMAVDRSRGHFFKSLYQVEEDEEAEDAPGQPRRKALAERSLAPEAPPSNRAQLFAAAFLAGVLVTAVAADASAPAPAWGLDALYLLLATGLAAVAWGSRSAL